MQLKQVNLIYFVILILCFIQISYAGELVYSTFLGGSNSDYIYGIAVDNQGNVYVTGYTYSSDFPTTSGAYDTTYNQADVFVAKLSSSGSKLIYSTYLGGSSGDYGYGIALDRSKNVYITGYTSSSTTFPTTTGAYDRTYNGGGADIFVCKLNSSGSALSYSTFIGGSGADYAYAIALDSSWNAYITGYTTSSTSFPVTSSAYDLVFNGGSIDAYIVKLNSTGSSLGYASFLGGGVQETGYGIAVDTSRNAYVTGYTSSSTNFPTTTGTYDRTYNGGYSDIFLTKFNSAGSSLVYSTFLGGSGSEEAHGLALDNVGNVYLTGYTGSTTGFPITANVYDSTPNGYFTNDIFLTKFNSTGTGLIYSTFLGGTMTEQAYGLTIDGSGNAYLTGYTNGSDFPVTPNAFDTSYNYGYMGYDAFVSKMNPTGSILLYSTFLGGSNDEIGKTITIDNSGNIYAAGQVESSNYPITSGAYDTTIGGGSYIPDGFITKINLWFPMIKKVLYFDTDLNGVDQGDKLIVQFDKRVRIIPTQPGDFYIPVEWDTFGTGATKSLNTVNDTQVIIILGTSPTFTIDGLFNFNSPTPGSPSGLDISAYMAPNAIEDLTGVDAQDGGVPGIDDSGIDIQYTLSARSTYVSAYSAATIQVGTDTANAYYTKHQLLIPKNSLKNSATITIGPPGDDHGQLSAVRFTPSTLTFSTSTPAFLLLEYKDDDIRKEAGFIEYGMRLHQWKNSANGWVRVPQTFSFQSVDFVNKRVMVKIDKINMVGATDPSFSEFDNIAEFLAANTAIVYANISIPTVGAKTAIVAASPAFRSEDSDILYFASGTTVTITIGTTGIYSKHRLTLTNYTTAYSGVTIYLNQATLSEMHGWGNYAVLKISTNGTITTSATLTMEYKDYTDPNNQFRNDVTGGEEAQLRIFRWRDDLSAWERLPGTQSVNAHANLVTATIDTLSLAQIYAVAVDATISPDPYLNSYGGFTVGSDSTHWYFERYADASNTGTLSWLNSYTGRSGILKLEQTPGQKAKLTQMFSVPSTGWYTAIAKVCTDIGDMSKHQKVYLYLQELDTDISIIATGNQAIQPGANGFAGPGHWRELQIAFYANRTTLGVQVVGINPSTSGVSGNLYIDDIWVYAGGPKPNTTITLNNPNFTSSTSGWILQTYADGSGSGTWSWVSSWSSHNGVLKGIQTAGQKAKWSQLFAFPNDENMALNSIWVYSSATSSSQTPKVYLYLYSYNSGYSKVIESGNAILQYGKWTPNTWRQLQFGYTPWTLYNAVQFVAINPSGKPTQTIYFDDVVVKQD